MIIDNLVEVKVTLPLDDSDKIIDLVNTKDTQLLVITRNNRLFLIDKEYQYKEVLL